MSRTIDEHVVEMRFNNEAFEKKTLSTIKVLDSLKESLDFSKTNKNLEELTASANKVNVSHISNELDSVHVRFSALQSVSDQLWRNITNGAINTSKAIIGAISTPLKLIEEGGKRRALNIANAKFQLEGLGIAWKDIEDDISYGVKDTAYGLDSAAKVASQLVASQVKLGKEMKTSLRAISGVAAMTNSSYDEIGHIFTTVAGNGKLMTMQLNQLAGRGLNVAATLAKALGKTETEIREMVSHGDISFKMFADAMDSAFGEHAKAANKTFEGALSNVKAALARTGVDVAASGFEGLKDVFNALIPVINNFNEKVKPITSVLSKGIMQFSEVVTLAIGRINSVISSEGFGSYIIFIANSLDTYINRIYKSLRKFIDNGNVEKIIYGLVKAFNVLMFVLRTIYRAFKAVFGAPIKLINGFKKLTNNIKNFSFNLEISEEMMGKIEKVATKVFEIIKNIGMAIGWVGLQIWPTIKAIGAFIAALTQFMIFPELNKNPFEELFGSEFVQYITTKVARAIDGIKNGIKNVVYVLKELWSKIKDVPQVKKIIKDLGILILGFFDSVFDAIGSLKDIDLASYFDFDGIADKVGSAIDKLYGFKDAVVAFFKSFKTGKKDMGAIKASVQAINTTFEQMSSKTDVKKGSLGIISGISDRLKQGFDKITEFVKGPFERLKDILDRLSAGEIILNSFAISIDAFLISLASLNFSGSKALKKIKGFFGSISGMFKELKKSMQKLTNMLVIEHAFTTMVIALAAMVAAVAVLAYVYDKNPVAFHAAMDAMFSLMEFLAIVMVVLGLGVKFNLVKGLVHLTTAISRFAIGIAALSVACLALGIADPDAVAHGMIWLSTLMAASYIFVKELAKLPEGKIIQAGGLFLAFATSIGMIAFAVAGLALLPNQEKVNNAVLAIGSIIVAFGVVATVLTYVAGLAQNAMSLLAGGGGILLFSFALFNMAISLLIFSKLDGNKIFENIGFCQDLLIAVGALCAMVTVFSSQILAGGAGMLMLSLGLLSGVLALKVLVDILSTVDDTMMFRAIMTLTVVGVLFGTLSSIFSYLNKGNGNAAGAMSSFLMFSAGISLIAMGMALLATQPWQNILAATVPMLAVIMSLGFLVTAITEISRDKLVDWKPLLVLIGGVAIVATALAILATVSDPEKIVYASLALLASMKGFSMLLESMVSMKNSGITWKDLILIGEMIAAIGMITTGLIALSSVGDWSSILAAGAALGIVGAIMPTILVGFAEATKVIDKTKILDLFEMMVIISGSILAFAFAMKLIGSLPAKQILAAGAAIGIFIAAMIGIGYLATFLPTLGPALVSLGLGIISLSAGCILGAVAIAAFAAACLFASSTIPIIISSLNMGVIAFMELLQTLAGNAMQMGQLGGQIVLNFLAGMIMGISYGIGSLLGAVLAIPKCIVDGICKALGISNGNSTSGNNIALNFIAGLVKGLLSGLGKIASAIKNIASTIVDGLRSLLGIHSPSTVGDDIGQNYGLGLSIGLDKSNPRIANSIKGIGNTITTGLDGITSDCEFDIIPNLDMSNLENSNLGDLFNGGSITSDLSGQVTANMSGDTIAIMNKAIDQLSLLRGDVEDVKSRMMNLKVYLNGNTLVGALTPQIDQRLGNSYKNTKRLSPRGTRIGAGLN